MLAEVTRHDADDFFEFEIEMSGQGIMGWRAMSLFTVHASLAGSPFVDASLALEHRYGQIPTETLRTEGLLHFAGIEPVEVEAIPLELQIAEKVYEYTSAYESVIESNGVDSLFDLSAIAKCSGLDSSHLREAIDRVFEMNDARLPDELHRPPVEWTVPFGRLAEAKDAPDELAGGHDAAAALLDPVLSGKARDGMWNASQRKWISGSANGHHPS